MRTTKALLAATALVFASGFASAALTPDELKQLGTTLTPWGAIKAGNKEGTIPPYEGGLPKNFNPPGFKPNSGHWADPFADEKPLYTITAQNMDKYADKLGMSQMEMLKRFPNFYINVYPTHRTVRYPDFWQEATRKNAEGSCRTIENELAVKGCRLGMPFPIPKTGYEAMWNAIFGYSQPHTADYKSVYVDASGTPVVASQQLTTFWYPYNDQNVSMEELEAKNIPNSTSSTRYYFPARLAGDENITIFVNDSLKTPNRGFRYQQGVRRVRVLPETGYDFPIISSGGAQFYDDSSMFLGKMDKFDFKLVGKKEMIIPYNNYRTNETTYQELTSTGKHPNPKSLRFELHRVWVVEATKKPGQRHAYGKRRWYIDEDHPKWGMSEAWDDAGKPYRGIWMMSQFHWDVDGYWVSPNIALNLNSGVWYYSALLGDNPGFKPIPTPGWAFFTPEGIMRRSQR